MDFRAQDIGEFMTPEPTVVFFCSCCDCESTQRVCPVCQSREDGQ